MSGYYIDEIIFGTMNVIFLSFFSQKKKNITSKRLK